MSAQSVKSKVKQGAVWSFMEKVSTLALGFVVGMVLARLLTPGDFGTVALITIIFFAVKGLFVDGGFGNALIQKKDADDLDFNSLFYLNVSLSLVAYVVLFCTAPWIVAFCKTPELTTIVRVAAIGFAFTDVNTQVAQLTKKVLFHFSFRVSLITAVASAVCGVTLAFRGFGVWALVWSMLFSNFVGIIARWIMIAWCPKSMFSFRRLKPLLSYSWTRAGSALLDKPFVNLNGLLIGKFSQSRISPMSTRAGICPFGP